jgi:pimeloyl-ACP methyl ester carboxylesterase
MFRTNAFRFTVLIALLLSLAACAEPEAAPPPPPTAVSAPPSPVPTPAELPTAVPVADATPGYVAQLEEGGCPEQLAEFDLDSFDVTCAYLTVPEDRLNPDRASVELAVAIIPSRSANPRPDPIIYLEGGPGGSALLGISSWIDSPLRDDRALILFDQRGTGLSLPSLNCVEEELAEDDEAATQAVEACRERLIADGVDLNAYTTAANAADVADLIEQLGYDEVNLFGISYGTRLALAVLRDHAAGVRSVILDSPYPPNVAATNEQALNAGMAIQAMLRGCAADSDCNEAFPDLEKRFYALLERLNDEPLMAELVDLDGEVSEAEVTGEDLVSRLSDWLYVTDYVGYMPLMIAELEEGITDTYAFLASEGDTGYRRQSDDEEGDLSDSEGMFYSLECREEAPFGSIDDARDVAQTLPEPLREPLIAQVEGFLSTCDIWQVDAAMPREGQAVRSAIPTLVLAGEYDPVTPPWWGEIAAETLTNSYFYVLPGGGHAVVDASECVMQITQAFLNTPTAEPDASCLEAVRPVFELGR